jgi:hypothetical protein
VVVCYAAISQAAPPGYYGHRGNPHHAALHNELDHREFHRELAHADAHRYPMSWWQHERLHDGLDHEALHDQLEHRAYHRYARPGCAPVVYAPPIYGVAPSLGIGYASPGFSFWYSR